MKKLMLVGVALIGFCSFAQAQNQADTASTNFNGQAPTEVQNDTKSDEMKTKDAETTDEQNTDQELQQDADALEKNFEGSTIDKVGPNGEKLFMERGKYFYYNEAGKKIKVKKSEVRDKSQNP